jgi:excisionase family DNA binding protein
MTTNRSEQPNRPNGTVIPLGQQPVDETENERSYSGPTPVIDTGKLTYTVDEAAYLLDLSRGVTYQYVREGIIPAQRIGRRWVIPRRRFHAWLDGREAS